MFYGLKFNRKTWKRNKGESKGILHFHSNFSYDGHNSLEEIVHFLKDRGYSFACPTEHDDDFDSQKMTKYVKTCENVSDDSFKVIPGLEFRCENKVHILGIGIEKYFSENNPVEAAVRIKQQGGMAIIAHPEKYINNITKELLKAVDGVEIWNAPKDSRFFPHYKVLNYYKKIKNEHSHLKAVCGLDMHSLDNFFELNMIAQNFSGEIKSIWDKSNPDMQGKYMTLSIGREGSFGSIFTLVFMRGVLNILRYLRNLAQKTDD